jgi:IclR helix-turn-helix domain
MSERDATRVQGPDAGAARPVPPAQTGPADAAKPPVSRRWQRRPRPGRARAVPARSRETVSIELSTAQVDRVLRAAGAGGTTSALLSALNDPTSTLAPASHGSTHPQGLEDRRLSRSLLSGLLVLSCFPGDGGYLGIAELARMLGMNNSTAHRYVSTLLAVGLLERDAATRRYRRLAP